MNSTPLTRVAVAGVILAGGQSTRMGEPKEGVGMADGRAMIEHVADAMRPLTQRLTVVGASTGFDPAGLGAKHLRDLRPGEGPLAGIETALASGQAEFYLFATCDQPLLTAAMLALLLPGDGEEGVIATALRAADGRELLPFPCAISATALPALTQALDGKERSPRHWLRTVALRWRTVSEADSARVESINTRQQLARLSQHRL